MDIISTNKHLHSNTWNAELRRHGGYPEPEKRGLILESVSRGVEEIWKRYAPPTIARTPLAVPLEPTYGDWEAYEGRLFYALVPKIIIATRKWLDSMNRLPADREVSITGYGGEVCLQGKLSEVVTLMGSEEADHALFRHENLPTRKRDAGDLRHDLAYYDSNPIEFRALERQLVVGTELGFPEFPTLRALKLRIETARKMRELLGE